MIERSIAKAILEEYTKTASLLRHARSVEIVMRALAKHFGEDEEKYGVVLSLIHI